ncbi:MAG: Rrf2 family transcriptional regulator [Gemmataceae bacterium]
MTPYGKTAQYAIAAMSRLAEVYSENRRLSSGEIAEQRHLPRPIIAKVLTVLSQAGLVVGSPGPGGGYALSRPPAQITLYDVADQFDRLTETISCPLGPTWCGNNAPCPLHEQLTALREQMIRFLQSTTLAAFVKPPQTSASLGPKSLNLVEPPRQ